MFSPAHITDRLLGFTTNKLHNEYKTLNNLSTRGLLKFFAHNLYSFMSLIKAMAPKYYISSRINILIKK